MGQQRITGTAAEVAQALAALGDEDRRGVEIRVEQTGTDRYEIRTGRTR